MSSPVSHFSDSMKDIFFRSTCIKIEESVVETLKDQSVPFAKEIKKDPKYDHFQDLNSLEGFRPAILQFHEIST